MPTLHKLIAEKFLAALAQSPDLDAGKIAQLRVLLENDKRVKTDDLVKIFSQPAEGDLQ